MSDPAERVAYFNGRILPESEVLIPLRDAGFLYGYAVFDTLRTFHHRLYRLEEHLDRLTDSMRYLGLDPDLSREELGSITEEVVRLNTAKLDTAEDLWVTQRVTLGQPSSQGWQSTVIVECKPVPFAERATCYSRGIDCLIPSIRRTPPEAVSPRAKTHNYLNLLLADREVKARNPDAWSVLLDTDGNLCEGIGSNLFLVQKGVLRTPREQMVLPGISRSIVIDLAGALGIPFEEADLDLFDAAAAQEAFLTSTSLCLCPISSINARPLPTTYGPITQSLIDAWKEEIGVDFVQQYLDRLEQPAVAT